MVVQKGKKNYFLIIGGIIWKSDKLYLFLDKCLKKNIKIIQLQRL